VENYLLIEEAHLKLAKAKEAGKRTNVKPISLRLEIVPQSRKGGCLFYKGEGIIFSFCKIRIAPSKR